MKYKQISHILLPLMLTASLPVWGNQEVERPPAFEKLYVTPSEVLSTPEGTFYLSPTGETLKVSSVNRDGHGSYVILITRQCPACGRYYTSDSQKQDDFCCPLWEPQEDKIFTRPNR